MILLTAHKVAGDLDKLGAEVCLWATSNLLSSRQHLLATCFLLHGLLFNPVLVLKTT